MKNKPIILVGGEPYSIFFEIFFKSLKKTKIKNIKNPIILIASKKLLIAQMKELKYKFKIVDISFEDLNSGKINNRQINIINVNFKFKKGKNEILVFGKSYGTYESIVTFKIINPNNSQLNVKVVNEDGSPHSFGYFKIKGDKTSINEQLDKNGEKKLWLKPGDYKIISTKSENYIWSSTISLDEKEIHEETIIISKKSIISGKVFTSLVTISFENL